MGKKSKLRQDQVEKIQQAIIKKLSSPSKPKTGKVSEMDKKIMSILRVHGKDADINSLDADSLRTYLHGFENAKPEWLTGDVNKKPDKKNYNDPSELYTMFEKDENKYNERLEELWTIVNERQANIENVEEREKMIVDILSKDKRLNVLKGKMKKNIENQQNENILENYVLERENYGRDFHPNIQSIIDGYTKPPKPVDNNQKEGIQ